MRAAPIVLLVACQSPSSTAPPVKPKQGVVPRAHARRPREIDGPPPRAITFVGCSPALPLPRKAPDPTAASVKHAAAPPTTPDPDDGLALGGARFPGIAYNP